MFLTRSIRCSRNYVSSMLHGHRNSMGRTFCKTTEQPKSTDESEETTEHPKTEDVFDRMDKLQKSLKDAKPYEEIPKLPMIPFFGSSWMYFPFIGKFNSTNMYEADFLKQKMYGDIVREKFGNFEMVNSYVPETNSVLRKHGGAYPARAEFTTLKTYRQRRKEWYEPIGLVAMQGPEWKDFRRKVTPYIMNTNNFNMSSIGDTARDFVNLVRVKRDSNKQVPDLISLLSKWSLETVSVTALDTRLGCLDPNLGPESDGMRMIKSVQTQLACMNKLEASSGNFPFWKYFPTPTWLRFLREADVFTGLVFKYIKLTLDDYFRHPDAAKTTILQKMIVDQKLDIKAAMVAVADIIMAGIDTTAHLAGYLLYNIAKHPDKQERLYEDIMEMFPDKTKKIDQHEHIRYYYYCLRETWRTLPVVRGNLRIFDHDIVLQGYRIPAGVAVLAVEQVFIRDERFYKDATKFTPERYFVKRSVIPNKPFGIQGRSCIGEALAQREIYSLVLEVLRHYRLECHEDIKLITRLVNIPDRPIKMRFIER